MRDDLVIGANFFDQCGKAVGRLESAAGRVGLIRGDLVSPALRQGELVYQGDAIEAGADGSAAIRLVDGTTFYLGPDSSIVIEAFDPTEGSPSPSTVKIVHGEVGFFPGRKVRDGRLNIETPSAAIRGTGTMLGVGSALGAGLAALFVLCLVKEAGAASEEIVILDFDDVTFKDLHHGTFEVVTKGQNPQVFIVDDPGRTLVLHPRGSGFSIEIVANTRAQMLDLQNAYKSAYDIFSLGLRDPFFQLFQRTASGTGSGGTLDAFQPGKFDVLIFNGLRSDLATSTIVYRNIDQKTGDGGPPPTLITIPADVKVLPISRFQIGEVDFSPNISISFPPTYQKLISVTFQHVPAGYIIKDGHGNTYSGPSFTILAADYYSGLTLTTPASGVTEAYLEVSATVDGLGGPVESVPVRMPLTLDQDPTDKVKWTGNTGLWEINANWNTGVAPLPTQDVVIAASTTGVVDVTSSTDISLNSLRLDAGTTLEIVGGHFTISAADNNPLSNEGTVKIGNGASFTVGNALHPGQSIDNSGMIEAVDGSIIFISANIANAAGQIQIDAPSILDPSILELQDTTIDSGELINFGLVKVTSGASNSIHDLSNFWNAGELRITGSGTELLLSNETLDNTGGGLVVVDLGAILELQKTTIDSGEITNHGLIEVTSDASNSIRNIGNFFNYGELRITGSGTELLLSNEVLNNAGGLVVVDPGAILELQNTAIDSGGLINLGLVKVTSGAWNSIYNLSNFLNAGELRIAGSGTELLLSNETLNNTGGLVVVDPGAILNLTAMIITGGTLSGTGEINIIGDTTLDGSSGHPVTIDSGTAVTVHTGTTLTLEGWIQGGGEISVAGSSAIVANGDVDVPINAAALADDALLTLSGTSDLIVTHLKGDLDAAGLSGKLDVTTADIAGAGTIDITAGSNNTSITAGVLLLGGAPDDISVHAAALADGKMLTLKGPAHFIVDDLIADLDAANLSGNLDVTAADVADLSVTTGSGQNKINAQALASGHVLNLKGDDDASVSLTDGNLDAHIDTGELTVKVLTNGAASSNTITTGSNDNTVTGDEAADNITVAATSLADGKTLTLDGLARFTVTNLKGDLYAAGLDGQLDVTTTDIAATGTIDITAGSNNTSITAGALLLGGAPDDISVHAAALADGKMLTLKGPAHFTVDDLIADLDAANLSGKLDVTAADVADLSITTGSGSNTIDAGALASGHILNLKGDDGASIWLKDGNLDAHTDTGVLAVEVQANNAASSNAITTGSNDIHVTGDEAADSITVNASALADGKKLTLDGQAHFIVTNLKGDLTATNLSGKLDVNTADIAGAGTIDITTGSNDTSITAGALLLGGMADDVSVHAAALADGKTLVLKGPAHFIVDGLIADLDAENLSGNLNVTAGDVADLTITTGSGANNIDATALAGGHVLNLKDDDDASVSLTDGNLDAHTDTGALTVEVLTNNAASSNTITAGSNDIGVTGEEALDHITIDATALTDGKKLTLDGQAQFTVNNLKGDLDAAGLDGQLDVTTTDIAATGTIDITTGSNNTSITAGALLPGGAPDDISVHAAALADGKTLALGGAAHFIVDDLIADLDAANLSGNLDVTTADVADLTITTGSGANTIDATALADNHVLNLKGDDGASIWLKDGNLDAHTDTGVLAVEVQANNAASSNAITTGSNNITVTGDEAADNITVDAGALATGKKLTLDGQADFTVTNLGANVDATNLQGSLTVTGTSASNIIIGGSGNDTIDGSGGGDALTGGQGQDNFVFTENEGSNTITDFHIGQDHIVLSGFGIFSSASDPDFQAFLSNLQSQASGVHDINVAGTTIVLNNVDVNQLQQSDFVVQ